ncbi:MAG: carboxypeptidase regulatory-like domain-containing protein, partial [Muribaculaceae bacterium]|nr:carboxypeptidase regulatory-like domain-containing protein [Muribaculaceae bacterium]
MRRILLIALTLATAVVGRSATINGMLVDATDTLGLIEATVKLVTATKDSTFVKGTTTDVNGVFNLRGVKAGHYVLKLSYMGYTEQTRRVSVGADGRDVNI